MRVIDVHPTTDRYLSQLSRKYYDIKLWVNESQSTVIVIDRKELTSLHAKITACLQEGEKS